MGHTHTHTPPDKNGKVMLAERGINPLGQRVLGAGQPLQRAPRVVGLVGCGFIGIF